MRNALEGIQLRYDVHFYHSNTAVTGRLMIRNLPFQTAIDDVIDVFIILLRGNTLLSSTFRTVSFIFSFLQWSRNFTEANIISLPLYYTLSIFKFDYVQHYIFAWVCDACSQGDIRYHSLYYYRMWVYYYHNCCRWGDDYSSAVSNCNLQCHMLLLQSCWELVQRALQKVLIRKDMHTADKFY